MAAGEKPPRRRWVSGICWVLSIFFLLWAVVRIGGYERGFPAIQLIAYTPYVLVLSMFGLLAVVLCRRWLAAGFLLLAVIGLSLAVLPREMGEVETVPGGQSVRMLAINLGVGYADPEQVVELARNKDADLVAVQELTPQAAEELDQAGFSESYPERVLMPAPGATGGGVYSRWPLTNQGSLRAPFNQPVVDVGVPASIPIRVVSVHPMAPATPGGTSQWARDFEQLPGADSTELPMVLAGDFNATLDHVKLRDLLDTGYRDAADVTGNGLVTTWPTRLDWKLPVTLDHILAQKGISIGRYDVDLIDGTDHRAVFAELIFPVLPEPN